MPGEYLGVFVMMRLYDYVQELNTLGAVVTQDVPANAVAAGVPARVIKMKDEKNDSKTALVDALREL